MDLRFATDDAGELYVLTKRDGMIRKVVGARLTAATAPAASVPLRRAGQCAATPPAADLRIPCRPRPSRSPPARRRTTPTAPPATAAAQGAVKAGTTLSIIEEQGGKQPPDLTDDEWDHGATDADIFTVTNKGVPPTMMVGSTGASPTRRSGTS